MKIKNIMFNEAKFSKPILAYHGTQSKYLRSILKKGLVSENKGFGADIQGSMNNRDMSAVGGIYFSTSARYAGFAAKMQSKVGDYGLIEASVQPRSSYMDEDDIANNLKNILSPSSMSIERDVLSKFLAYLYDDAFRRKMIDLLKSSASKLKRQNDSFFDLIIKSHYLRIISYINVDKYYQVFKDASDKYDVDVDVLKMEVDLLDSAAMEKIYKNALDRLTRALKSTTYNFDTTDSPLGNSFRIDDNITYSGNNKIVGVFRIDESTETINVLYGTADNLIKSSYYQNYKVNQDNAQ